MSKCFVDGYYSDPRAWHTNALLALCDKKGSRPNFPLFQVGKQSLVKISAPDHIGCKLADLGPPGVFWTSPALRLFNNPRTKSVTRKHAQPPDVSEGQSCNLSKKNQGDKSKCWKFLGGHLALTQFCLRSCYRSAGC